MTRKMMQLLVAATLLVVSSISKAQIVLTFVPVEEDATAETIELIGNRSPACDGHFRFWTSNSRSEPNSHISQNCQIFERDAAGIIGERIANIKIHGHECISIFWVDDSFGQSSEEFYVMFYGRNSLRGNLRLGSCNG